MKKKINEPDFFGGQGPLTKEEELILSQYLAAKKNKKIKPSSPTAKKKPKQKTHI